MKSRPINLRDWQVQALQKGTLKDVWLPIKPQPTLSENGYNSVMVWGHHEWHAPYGDYKGRPGKGKAHRGIGNNRKEVCRSLPRGDFC